MLVSAGVVFLTIGLGFPVAWRLMANRCTDPVQVVGVAAIVGLMFQVAVGLTLVRIGQYRQSAFIGCLVVLIACTARLAWNSIRSSIAARGPVTGWSWLGLAPAVVTFAVPKQPAYFLFETGDMGDYVNSANVAADTGRLIAGFPHGLTVLMANVHLVFGEASVAALTPALGALFVLLLVAAARSLGVPLVPAIVGGVVAAVNPVTVWFSVFPVSELLYASMVLGLALLLAAARSHESPSSGAALAILAGASAGGLMLVRGNAMLVLPIVVFVQVLSWSGDDRRKARVQAWFTMTAVASLLGAYAYDVKFLPQYFVQNQLRGQLSQATFDRLGSSQLLGPSLVLALSSLIGVAALGAVLVLVDRHRHRDGAGRSLPSRVGIGVAAVATVVYVVGAGAAGTVDGFERWGLAIPVAAVLGFGHILSRTEGRTDPLAWSVPVLIGFAGVGLYAKRVPETFNHAYFLYVDRYLLSEGFPIALLLGCAALSLIWRRLGALRTDVRLAVMAAITVAAVAPVLPTTALARQHELFGDAYGTLDSVAEKVPVSSPIVFSGPEEPPEGWFFPNTFRALATPLTETFDRQVLNLPLDAFASDPRPTPRGVERLISDSGRSTGFLFVARAESAPQLDATELPAGAALITSDSYRVWILPKRVNSSEEEFRAVDLVLDLYRVEIDR